MCLIATKAALHPRPTPLCWKPSLERADKSYPLKGFWEKMDQEKFFTVMATDRIVGHWDGPCGRKVSWPKANGQAMSNNFFLWFDERSGMFSLLPWGVDQTFLGSKPLDADDASCDQFEKCLGDKGCRQSYNKVYGQVKQTLAAKKTALLQFAQKAARQIG